MAIARDAARKPIFADKEALLAILERQDKESGFVPDPSATAQKAREQMLADGVRPEDRILSLGIIEMREE